MNLEFHYASYDRFDLEVIDNPECKANFRFEKHDLPVLAEALHLPHDSAVLGGPWLIKRRDCVCF